MTESRNAPKVIVKPRDRVVETTLSFAVSGAPNIPAQHSGKPLRPEVMVIKLQDGDFHHVRVTGPRIGSADRFGHARARKAWYSITELERDAPVWVRDAVTKVLQQEGAR